MRTLTPRRRSALESSSWNSIEEVDGLNGLLWEHRVHNRPVRTLRHHPHRIPRMLSSTGHYTGEVGDLSNLPDQCTQVSQAAPPTRIPLLVGQKMPLHFHLLQPCLRAQVVRETSTSSYGGPITSARSAAQRAFPSSWKARPSVRIISPATATERWEREHGIVVADVHMPPFPWSGCPAVTLLLKLVDSSNQATYCATLAVGS